MSARALAATLAQRASEVAAALEARDLTAAELPAALDAVGALRRLIDSLGAELAGQVDELSPVGHETSLARRLGEKSAADVVAIHAGVGLAEARDWCRVGRALRPRVSLLGEVLPVARPAVAVAVAAGRLTVASASRLLSALDEAEPCAPAERIPALEIALVEKAAELTQRELGRLCRALPDIFDPDGAEPREDLIRRRSGLWVRQGSDGLTDISIRTHPEGAGFILAALDARTTPNRQPTFLVAADVDDVVRDDRPLAQRRLDALQAIARESLASDSGQVGGTAVAMTVTVGLDALLSGIGTAKISGIDEPISAATARRLAAQAEIIPMVLGGPSDPLDVGVGRRLGTSGQRRALAQRDRGCLWPGCNAPPGWCEVAHIVAWVLGGETDLDNLALLCPFHHRRFDNDGWTLERRGKERYLIPPAHLDASRTPRRVGAVELAA